MNDPTKILNPKTGKYVLKSGALGKKILSEQNTEQNTETTSIETVTSKFKKIKIVEKKPEPKVEVQEIKECLYWDRKNDKNHKCNELCNYYTQEYRDEVLRLLRL